jgi:hypothetical protein
MVIEEKAKKVENEVENEIETKRVAHFKLKLLYISHGRISRCPNLSRCQASPSRPLYLFIYFVE